MAAEGLLLKQVFACAGELFDQIDRKGRLPLDQAQTYAAEIVLILEYLRKMQVSPPLSANFNPRRRADVSTRKDSVE